jgi:hypothetical protein
MDLAAESSRRTKRKSTAELVLVHGTPLTTPCGMQDCSKGQKTRSSYGLRNSVRTQGCNLFVWLAADGWCWFVLREKYCWLVVGGWFVLREDDGLEDVAQPIYM